MQAIILAAGMGKRLAQLTKDSTKCMLYLNGRRLIEYTLDAIFETKVISRIIMVVGHGAEEVKSFLGREFKGIPLEYVYNLVYYKTNNIYSLLLTKNYLETDDTLLFESDLIFDKSILTDLINEKSSNVAIVAKFESWMDGTVALLDDSCHVNSFISRKDFTWLNSERYFKTVNIYKLSKEFCSKAFVPFLSAYVSANGMNCYYEEVFKVLSFIDSNGLKALPIGNKLWYEIDDVQDLDIATTLFAECKDKVSLIQKRYGGYWRFPQLKDYCYLVNPYFPPTRMVEEMQNNYFNLLSQYPSGQDVQRLIAAKMFGCDKSYILVGNGSSELIKGLIPNLKGNICIPFPTFNEYYETIQDGKLVEFHSTNDDFSYLASDLIYFCKNNDVSNLILINPDNPTGHFLSKNDVLMIAQELGSCGKFLILDESFVDFVDGSIRHSLIDNEILSKYLNLVVIKSISKSFGVPGLRLGIIATANSDLLQMVRKYLPIWNINSFGEYFLQIICKYLDDYNLACRSLIRERERFFNKLKEIEYLKPVRSYANYILCEVSGGMTSNDLTHNLLNNYSIFIKDCRGKKGVGDRYFIRLAIQKEQYNNYLIKCIKEIFNVQS